MPSAQPDPLNPSRMIYTYEDDPKPKTARVMAAVNLAEITAHIEQYVGPTGGVFHEIVSDQVHIDVILVPPTPELPQWTLVTSGMSDRPMRLPKAPAGKRYAELLIRLPASWPVPGKADQADWKKEENYWPIRLLKTLSRFPSKYGAFLWVGHTLDNGQPPEPWSAGTSFNSAFLAPSRTLPKEFENLRISDEKTIKFLAIYPIFSQESALARHAGAEALWKKLVEHQLTDIVDNGRTNMLSPAVDRV